MVTLSRSNNTLSTYVYNSAQIFDLNTTQRIKASLISVLILYCLTREDNVNITLNLPPPHPPKKSSTAPGSSYRKSCHNSTPKCRRAVVPMPYLMSDTTKRNHFKKLTVTDLCKKNSGLLRNPKVHYCAQKSP